MWFHPVVAVVLSSSHPELYSSMVANISTEMQAKIEQLFVYADQRKAHRGKNLVDRIY